jgi:hypothetical protein
MTEAVTASNRCITVGITFHPAFIAALDDWAREVGGTRSGVLRRLAERGFAELVDCDPEKRERYRGFFEVNLRPRGRNSHPRHGSPARGVPGTDRIDQNVDIHRNS